jgi:hypothetical protein
MLLLHSTEYTGCAELISHTDTLRLDVLGCKTLCERKVLIRYRPQSRPDCSETGRIRGRHCSAGGSPPTGARVHHRCGVFAWYCGWGCCFSRRSSVVVVAVCFSFSLFSCCSCYSSAVLFSAHRCAKIWAPADLSKSATVKKSWRNFPIAGCSSTRHPTRCRSSHSCKPSASSSSSSSSLSLSLSMYVRKPAHSAPPSYTHSSCFAPHICHLGREHHFLRGLK